ncbi:MAG: 1-acyl-sn-glycerol-3-phosphate acyltransferase [Pseudomonadales bacterium]|nr:1-acyl-sn-glycerol-3-phosphate acyltransferase [Pseudomonadales bacterium]
MKTLARLILRLCGWQLTGAPPSDTDRYVVIAAPHTSNWDFPWMLLMAWASGMAVRWLGKHTLFWGPMGPIMRALGGVPVRRHVREDRVAATARAIRGSKRIALVIPPEGTRGLTDTWRSGFYYIARTAEVPLVPTALDYAERRGEIGPAFIPTGDVKADMDRLRTFYTDRSGCYPERFGPVRLREEDDTD